MKFEEIMPAIREGKKVTRLEWGYSFYYDPLEQFPRSLDVADLIADDWVILTSDRIELKALKKRIWDLIEFCHNNTDGSAEEQGIPKDLVELIDRSLDLTDLEVEEGEREIGKPKNKPYEETGNDEEIQEWIED